MLTKAIVSMHKVKFRVFETKQCRKCRKIHPMPSHRAIYHQAEGTEHDVTQQGHANAVNLLHLEYRAHIKELKKAGKSTSAAIVKRPLYQYSFEVEG